MELVSTGIPHHNLLFFKGLYAHQADNSARVQQI